MAKYKFTCPECGSHDLEEILVDATVTSPITSIEDQSSRGPLLTYSHCEHENSILDRYQCASCGEGLVGEGGEFLEEDGLIGSKYLTDEGVISHKDLIHEELLPRLAQAYIGMSGEELEELWNDQFPGDPVEYLGDSMYKWENDSK